MAQIEKRKEMFFFCPNAEAFEDNEEPEFPAFIL